MSFKIENPTFGTDPEFAVVSMEDPTKFVSVVGKLGGTKDAPLELGQGVARQEDNVMCEITIPPVTNVEDFIKFINYGKDGCNAILNPQGLELTTMSSTIYDDDQLESKAACEFGCSSSFNAYTEEIRPKPDPDNIPGLRTCGFHIHVGFTVNMKDAQDSDYFRFIKYMDLFLGIPSVLVDLDDKRRALYGQAGDCRVKELMVDDPSKMLVIIEYRTLGGNMLFSDDLIRWSFNQTKLAIDAFNNEVKFPEVDIETVINSSDQEAARAIAKTYAIEIPKIQVYTNSVVECL